MIDNIKTTFGSASTNRLQDASETGSNGARAALESFYYALNNRDIAALSAVWADHPLVQLNNPLGGILRGAAAVVELYTRIFDGRTRVQVEFRDIVEYLGDHHAVFAGREVGTYEAPGSAPIPLQIRTTRYFRYDVERQCWLQYHHHGSIDDADALAAYQAAIRG